LHIVIKLLSSVHMTYCQMLKEYVVVTLYLQSHSYQHDNNKHCTLQPHSYQHDNNKHCTYSPIVTNMTTTNTARYSPIVTNMTTNTALTAP
jgi:hypothetical protein